MYLCAFAGNCNRSESDRSGGRSSGQYIFWFSRDVGIIAVTIMISTFMYNGLIA
jgi:hypothetical protein